MFLCSSWIQFSEVRGKSWSFSIFFIFIGCSEIVPTFFGCVIIVFYDYFEALIVIF